MSRLARISLLVLGVVSLFAPVPTQARQGADKVREDKVILADLKKIQADLEKDKENATELKKLTEQVKKHVESAQTLLEEFEKHHAKSNLLARARSAALKVLDESSDEAVQARAVKLARALRAGAEKGSDHAAQADLVLLNADFNKMVKDVAEVEELKKVWAKEGANLHKQIEDYLDTYPNYRPALDALGEIAEVAVAVGATRTRKRIVDAALKNFPDHSLAKAARREEAVGKEFDFDFTPVGSKKATGIKELRGKVVVLDFWASWCGPCKKEMPALKKLYEKHAKEGLEIVGVSLDDKEQALTDSVKDLGIPWPQVFGETASKLADKWGLDAIPAMFVIDRKGKLRSVDARGKLEKLIPDLLAEK